MNMQNEKQFTIISLFDGMSGGQIALNEIGFKNYKYYASEIEEPAIEITQHNFPCTVQIGDIRNVRYEDGVLYTDNGNFEVEEVDLLIGGSPCQNLSFVGNRKGLSTKEGIEITTLCQYLKLKRNILNKI